MDELILEWLRYPCVCGYDRAASLVGALAALTATPAPDEVLKALEVFAYNKMMLAPAAGYEAETRASYLSEQPKAIAVITEFVVRANQSITAEDKPKRERKQKVAE
jgi:hypothetical protein